MLATAQRESYFIGDAENLVELLRLRAARQPERTAFEYLRADGARAGKFSFAELDLTAQAIARVLREEELSGRHAILAYPNGLEFVAALFGCFYAGVTAVPFYPGRRPDMVSRFNAICDDGGVTAVLAAPAFAQEMRALAGGNASVTALRWLDVAHATRRLPDPDFDGPIDQRVPAVIQYSSGSTESPKGVILSHENLWQNQHVIHRAFNLTERSVVVNWVPLHHDMGLIGGVLHSIFSGARCQLMSSATVTQQPLRWLKALSGYERVVSGGPNTIYDVCVDKIRPEERIGLDLSGWQVAFNGSEPVRWETLERFADTYAASGFRMEAFRPCYGLAEATLMVSGKPGSTLPVYCRGEGGVRMVASGATDPKHRVIIVNPSTRKPVPAGAVGEIWVAGPSVGQGYWNRPDQTRRTFMARLSGFADGRFLRTGDLGCINGDQLFIAGRIKDVIIDNGRNVYPQDVEYVVSEADPALGRNSGAVFPVELDGKQRLVIVHEVQRALPTNQFTKLIHNIRRAVIAKTNLLVHSVLLLSRGSLPRTTSGKIRRSACRSGFLNGSLEPIARWDLPGRSDPRATLAPHLEPSDAPGAIQWRASRATRTREGVETWLTQWLVHEGRVPPEMLRSNCSFADLGLDSGSAVVLAADLEDFLGHHVDPTLAWDYPTIGSLSAHLASMGERAGDARRGA